MNLKNGLIRFGIVLTVVVGIYGYFFNNNKAWDESAFVKLREEAIFDINWGYCNGLKIAPMSIRDLSGIRDEYFFFSKDSDTTRLDNDFNKPIYFNDGKCRSLLILVEKNRIKTPLQISDITEDKIDDYVSKFRSDSLSVYIKSQLYAVLTAITYLWIAIAFIFTIFFTFRWVYKGFKR